MGKKGKRAEREALAATQAVAGVVVITAAADGSFGFEIETELSPEVLEAVLKEAAAVVGGKVDRAAGAWGR